MNPHVQDLLTSGAALTDTALERLLPSATTPPHSIHRAMRHSTFAGGKRLRPVLCIEAARMVSARIGGADLPPGAADVAAALEMVHTYSLIHDDLPSLDNDDLRRGHPTCHVVFGEAIAILAGDALQTLAFQTLAHLPAPPSTIVAILRDFSLAIGTGTGPTLPQSALQQAASPDPANASPTAPATSASAGASAIPSVGAPLMTTASSSSWVGSQNLPPGMIGGQVMDIESEHHTPTADLVERIHRSKTGALITTSIVCGGLLGLATHPSGAQSTHSLRASSGADETLPSDTGILNRLRIFGEKAGLAFQIVDDILDMTQTSAELGKTAGKDTAATKATWPAVYARQIGIEAALDRSRQDAAALIADAFAALAPFGAAATPLKSLAQYLVDRTR